MRIGTISFLLIILMVGSLAAQPEPDRVTLKTGELTFLLLDEATSHPLSGVEVELKPAGPGARSLTAKVDLTGKATLRAESGNYLFSVDGLTLGVLNVSSRGEWTSCTILIPHDLSDPPRGRPDLNPEVTDEGLQLTARQTPMTPVRTDVTPADTPTDLDGFLRAGMIREGLRHFAEPTDNGGRFSLAVLQAIDGLQQFSAGLNRLSFRRDLDRSFQGLPFFRVAIPTAGTMGNEVATPQKIGDLFRGLRDAVRLANETVAGVDGEEFKVEVNLSRIRLDLSGDGIPGDPLLESIGPAFGIPPGSDEEIIVRFDSADAAWFQGYTHVVTGMLEVLLAYDWQPVWDQSAHLLFSRYDPAPAMAGFDPGPQDFGINVATIADLVATIHAIQLEVADPEALPRAREEFLLMVKCSRLSWGRILAETDDDHEWIPSPTQTGPMDATISQEEIDGWLVVLDELEAVLTGGKLLPHWRLPPGTGINLEKLVTSPPKFDLILMIQGSAFAPYIETGEVSDQDTWENLVAPFGGNFAGFAIWVN